MFDVFNTPKVLVAAVAALAILGVALVAYLRGHPVAPARSRAVDAAMAFGVIAVLATLFASTPGRALFGGSGAHAGLILYLSCLALFCAGAVLYRDRLASDLVKTTLAAAVPVVLYGIVQAADLDPLGWRSSAGGPPVFSTMGNANFFSAWCGIVAVLAAWGALTKQWSASWRMASATLMVAALAVGWASQSIQGPIAAVVGLTVLGAARLSDHGRHTKRLRRRVVLLRSLPVLAVIAGGLVVTTRGDAIGSFAGRAGKWHAALVMGRERPLTGFGLDLFVDWYHSYRPAFDAIERGLSHTADAAHSVPLQLLAGGGVPLLLAYVFFAACVGLMGLRAIRQSSGERRLLLGALAGAWVAYQVQAAVSIDVPALAVLHWVLAGLLVAAATPKPRSTAQHWHRRWTPAPAFGLAVLVGLVALAVAVPVRAEVSARRAIRFGIQGEHASSERALGIALRLNPWEPRYAVVLARQRLQRGDERQAVEAFALAESRSPHSMVIALEAARAADTAGDQIEAARLYDKAVALDPNSPHLRAEAARFHLRAGDAQTAIPLLERAVELDPKSSRWRRLLQRAQDGS